MGNPMMMGNHVIKMPDIGEGIAQVELVEWFVKVGDSVTEDQVLADVMTDKATVEIPSPVSGTVVSLGGQPGDVMAVGSELIHIAVVGSVEVAAPATPVVAPPEPDAQADDDVADEQPQPASAITVGAGEACEPLTPETPTPTLKPCPLKQSTAKSPLAAPAVRKRAATLNLDLHTITGTGPDGHIVHADLDALLLSASPRPPASAATTGDQQIPVIGLRRKIAERMQDAKRRVAHFSYVEEIDVTALEALRQQLNQRYGDSRGRLTLLPLLARALVIAVREFPQINARYDDEAQVITRHRAVHLGIATQSDNGLMVPVLRNAQAGDLWQNAREIARLAEAARSGKALRDELSGSTLTLSSLGPLGGIVSTPVVNTPEVAIVGVNRIVERPVVLDGQIVVRKMMNLSSSFDHRVVDGMDAARFIQAVRAVLEQPSLLFID
jgi:2-oxoisovalerate dehydrogenase E2 component (dihydrolipoyl transacylase)